MKILIVEDEKRMRNVFCKILEREGFDVIETSNPVDAYNVVVENQVDLVLLDINMMEVDGRVFYDVLQLFCRKAKVIVSSVYPLEDQKRLIVGADDYYDKSDSLQTLIGKVKWIMRRDMHSAEPA